MSAVWTPRYGSPARPVAAALRSRPNEGWCYDPYDPIDLGHAVLKWWDSLPTMDDSEEPSPCN